MSKYSKLGKLPPCGSVDSQYFGNTGQFDKDIKDKQKEHEIFKNLIKHLVVMDPSKMDLRYKDVIDALKELKEQHQL